MSSADDPRPPVRPSTPSSAGSSSAGGDLSPRSLEYLTSLVREHSAISLGKDKGYLVKSRLAPVAREAGLPSIDALVDRLRERPDRPLLGRVVDAMTTNETSFFRDRVPFEVLRDKILPELFERRSRLRQLHIWSAACASGQEPYSLAILLCEHFGRFADWKIRILGTDLSASVLKQARAGRYNDLEIMRGLSPPLRDRYFHRDGAAWQVDRRIQAMVEFRELNLISPWPPLPKMDIVLLRNVLVYFDISAKRDILARVRTILRDDGCLLLGGAESTIHIDPDFGRVVTDGFSYYVPPKS